MSSRVKRGGRRHFLEEDVDPSSLLSNMFDVSMVFAVALMVALVTKFNMTEVFSKEDYTIVKNPGKDNMEIIIKKGDRVEKYTPQDEQSVDPSKSRGKRVGIAYQLENGEIVYVPEE